LVLYSSLQLRAKSRAFRNLAINGSKSLSV
jgi:hypothetical protein